MEGALSIMVARNGLRDGDISEQRPKVKWESHGYLWAEGPASAKALGWDLGARGVRQMRLETGRRADRRP